MNYYILTNSANSKEIGATFPQAKIANMYKKSDYTEYRISEIPATETMPTFRIQYQAKMTDLLTEVPLGFPKNALISLRLCDVLIQFKSPSYQILDTIVIDKKNKPIPYKILHQYKWMDEYLDCSKTIFELTTYDFSVTHYTSKVAEFQVSHYDEIHELNQMRKGSISIKKMYLKKDAINYDFFTLSNPNIWVVNENVAMALKNAMITGIALIPIADGESFCGEDVVSKAQKLLNL